METRQIIYDGVRLTVPMVNDEPLHMPHNGFDDFGAYCGPGSGWGNALVPEDIYGICVSPACFIHDAMFDMAQATWTDFHHSNSVFFHNILNIIDHFDPPVGDQKVEARHERYYRAVTFYTAVDSGFGPSIFWHLKKKQGRTT